MLMRHRITLAVVLGLTGCQSPKKAPEVFVPKPRVEWTHITSRSTSGLQNDFRILATPPTQGLFPANLGVTRVSLESVENDEGVIEPRLFADPRNEFLQWNSALDDQMAVSEVFPIAQRDLGGREAEPQQILAAFRALDARLGLLYAVNELNDSQTEMLGALFDTRSAEPIAMIAADAVSLPPPTDEEKKAAEAEGKNPPDLWETDSRALVRVKFEKLVHRCVLQLIRNDEPAVIEAPTGWTPAGPIRPAEWPPRHLRTAP